MKRILLLVCLLSVFAAAKDTPVTLLWPSEDHPVLRFTFGKFVKLGSMASESSYSTDVTAENLWDKPIPSAGFDAYFFSKDGVRVGSGYIALSNVGLHETVKFALHFAITGAAPASLKLTAAQVPKELAGAAPAKKIRVNVYSVPAGAALSVDGEAVGTTPKQVELALGKHLFRFARDGYHDGSFPFEVGPDDVSGGTINFELGALAHDTIELRDGTSLIGDVESMNATAVAIRVGGKTQSLERNRVKRILLTEREVTEEEAQPAK